MVTKGIIFRIIGKIYKTETIPKYFEKCPLPKRRQSTEQ